MQERRKAERIDSLHLVHITSHDTEGKVVQQGIGRTINISEKGILLETHFEIDPNDRQTVSIGIEEEIVEIRAPVVHLQRMDDGTFQMGLAFEDLDAATLETLRGFVHRFKAHAAEDS